MYTVRLSGGDAFVDAISFSVFCTHTHAHTRFVWMDVWRVSNHSILSCGLWSVCYTHFFCRSKCLRVCASSVCTERHNQYTCTHNIKHTLQRLHIQRHPLCWNWTGPIELYCSYVHCTIHTNLIPKCEFLSYTRWVNGWAKEMQRVNILSSKKSVSKNPQRHLLGIPSWAFSNRPIMEFSTFEIVHLNFIQNNWIWIN